MVRFYRNPDRLARNAGTGVEEVIRQVLRVQPRNHSEQALVAKVHEGARVARNVLGHRRCRRRIRSAGDHTHRRSTPRVVSHAV
jgi:hypothetical protein